MANAETPRSRSRHAGDAPHPIDIHVGSRLRMRRNMLGISQEQLGELLGVTFQQVQKYERGTNRIGASRLWQISQVLTAPIRYFYQTHDPISSPGLSEAPAAFDADPLRRSETSDLVRGYYRIENPLVRKRLFDFVRTVAASRGTK